jgi:hypothetical protein
MKTPLLLASAFLFGACASSSPDYASHWNAGHVGASAEHVFTGYDAELDGPRYTYSRKGAEGIALTIRRHFMNDNPENPLQMRRGWGDPDNPYNMTAGIADAGYLVRDGAVTAWYTASEGVLMGVDLIVGVPLGLVGVNSGGVSSMWSDEGDAEPTPPSKFEPHNY